ncbi:MAG: hypothetical protein ABSB90_08095 [Thermoplasmata archaeon]
MTLTINGVSATETPYFWAVDISGSTNVASSHQAALLNATPIRTLRYGDDATDQSNWSNGCFYNGNSECSAPEENATSFGTLCRWLHDQCVLGVPAEINNVTTTMSILHWLAGQTSWTPNCWAIGNEPQDWTHFNIPWDEWSAKDDSQPTAAQFAADAANLTAAIRHAYPNACIVGIENNANPKRTESWTSALASGDPNASAVAIHSYPDLQCTGPLLSLTNLTSLARQYRSAVAVSGGLPVYTHEFNIGLKGSGPKECPALGTPTDAVFVSANIAQALEVGMPQFAYYRFDCSSTPDCMFDAATGTPTPVYTLYSGLFTHMDIRSIRNVTFSDGVVPGLFAAEGSDNSTDRSLLLSNAVLTSAQNVSLAGVSPDNWTGEVYLQDSSGEISTQPFVPGMVLTLPPESTAVVKMFQAPSNGSGSGGGGGGGGAGGGGGSNGTSSSTWTIEGSVILSNSTAPAGLNAELTFSLQNGSSTQVDATVGLDGGFSVGNLSFAGTFESAQLGPGRYTVVSVDVNSLVPQKLYLTISAIPYSGDGSSQGNGTKGTSAPGGSGNSTNSTGSNPPPPTGNSPPGGKSPSPATTLATGGKAVVVSMPLGATLVAMTVFALGLSGSGAIRSARRIGHPGRPHA